MKKKRIAAWIGIILLAAVYLITILLGILGKGDTKDLLMAAVMTTVLVPVVMWAMMMFAGLMDKNKHKDEDE